MTLREQFQSLVTEFESIVPCSEVSGLRTLARNKQVGGSPNSAHLDGLAIDLILDDKSKVSHALSVAVRLRFFGIEWDARNEHLHLDMHPTGRIWRVWKDLEGHEHPLSDFSIDV